MRIAVKYDIKEIDNNEISSRDINSGSEIDTWNNQHKGL